MAQTPPNPPQPDPEPEPFAVVGRGFAELLLSSPDFTPAEQADLESKVVAYFGTLAGKRVYIDPLFPPHEYIVDQAVRR